MRVESSLTTQNKTRGMTRRLLSGLLTLLLVSPAALGSPPQTRFSGTWKQSGERCVPKRSGNVTQRIDLHGPDLIVETTILRPSGPPRHAVQQYRVEDGITVSTGADGDEFHTSVVWKGQSLAFSIEEHEDGHIFHSKEIWTLSANETELQVQRENLDVVANKTRTQTLLYTRSSPQESSH